MSFPALLNPVSSLMTPTPARASSRLSSQSRSLIPSKLRCTQSQVIPWWCDTRLLCGRIRDVFPIHRVYSFVVQWHYIISYSTQSVHPQLDIQDRRDYHHSIIYLDSHTIETSTFESQSKANRQNAISNPHPHNVPLLRAQHGRATPIRTKPHHHDTTCMASRRFEQEIG
jgi:hypothetical protein